MAIYVVKLNVAMAGVDTVEIPSEEEYEVGQTVTVSPNQATTFSSGDGRSVTIQPGVQINGTVVDTR